MAGQFRIGHGYDVHKLVEGRRCVIGGVEIESKLGLLGHSDADVLSHAIADAILGAAALPDIGFYFPPSDDSCKDINSQEIVKRAVAEVGKLGYRGFQCGRINNSGDSKNFAACKGNEKSFGGVSWRFSRRCWELRRLPTKKWAGKAAGKALARMQFAL